MTIIHETFSLIMFYSVLFIDHVLFHGFIAELYSIRLFYTCLIFDYQTNHKYALYTGRVNFNAVVRITL